MTDDLQGGAISLRAIGRSAMILTGSTAAVQALAILRELYVAASAGISSQLDALLIALVLPMTLAGVLTTGTRTALVPAYLAARRDRGALGARHFSGLITVWVGAGGLALSLALELLAAPAISVSGPGLAAAGHDAAVGYLRLLAPVAMVAAVSGTFYGICQAEERFAGIAWSGIAGSVVVLASLVLLWPSLGLGALAVGNLLGPIATVLVLLATMIRAGVVPKPSFKPSGPELGAFLRHAAPLTLSSAILQVNVIGDRAISSLLSTGAVSALRYGDVLVRTPVGAVGPAWGSALYPALVHSTHSAASSDMASAAGRALHYVLAIFIPISVLTFAVSPVAVSVAFERGAFSPEDAHRTAWVVAAFSPLIVMLMARAVLVSALNAQQRGRILLTGGAINVVINIVLDVALGVWLGVAGVALSSSITLAVVLLYFARTLARDQPVLNLGSLARTSLLATLASLPPAIVAGVLSWGSLVPTGTAPGLAFLIVTAVLGMVAYAALAAWLRVGEARALIEVGREWIRHRRAPEGPAA